VGLDKVIKEDLNSFTRCGSIHEDTH